MRIVSLPQAVQDPMTRERQTSSFSSKPRAPDPALWLWLGALSLASIALSRAFACATPFAALATLAAFTLRGRPAASLVLAVWFANQVVGFGFMHYPWTASTLGWGIAIGIAALAGLAAASAVARGSRLSSWLALLFAFAAYEVVLFAATAVLPSGPGAYAPAVVLRLFAINAVAFGLLFGAHRLAASAGLPIARTVPTPQG